MPPTVPTKGTTAPPSSAKPTSTSHDDPLF
jgi:hypothetical protein